MKKLLIEILQELKSINKILQAIESSKEQNSNLSNLANDFNVEKQKLSALERRADGYLK